MADYLVQAHLSAQTARIAAHDSIVSPLRQRRKIVKLLYHDASFGNTIERHDSMNASLQQRCRIVRLLYHNYTAENTLSQKKRLKRLNFKRI